METIWICIYRDTIEEHDESENLTEVLVTKKFFEQYFNERQKEYFDSIEDFLNEYTADNTEDFYGYAMEHNAVLQISMKRYDVIVKIIESAKISKGNKVWYIENYLKGYLTEKEIEWLWK